MENPQKILRPRHMDTEAIVSRLRKCKVGELVSYKELNRLIGGNVQTQERHRLSSARHILRNEDLAEFGVVTNGGIIRLDNEGSLMSAKSQTRKVRRAARRGGRILRTVKYDQLSPEQQSSFNVEASLLGVIYAMTGQKKVKQLQEAVEKTNERLSMERTLEAFQRHGVT